MISHLLYTILLAVLTSLALNTMLRLNNARKTYPSNDAFENATHLSSIYVKLSIGLYSVILGASILYLIYIVYHKMS